MDYIYRHGILCATLSRIFAIDNRIVCLDSAADSVRAKGLEIRIDEQYENLGRLTYRAQHTGEDLEQEVMEVIAKIDAMFDELESIKAAKEARKAKPAEDDADAEADCVCECDAEEAPVVEEAAEKVADAE